MFQQSVGFYNANAVAGDRASQNVSIYTPFNYLAKNDVTIGGFVWADTTDPTKKAAASGSGKPLGFAERQIAHYNYDLTSEGTMIVRDRGPLTIAVRGDFYVKGENAAVIGNKVFASNTDGSKIKFGAAGSSVEGYTETTFVALTAGDAGELIIISNWA